MTWNSGPMIGGATNWPRLNRSGFWTRPDPRDDTELGDDEDLTDTGTVDAPDQSNGGTDVPGTE